MQQSYWCQHCGGELFFNGSAWECKNCRVVLPISNTYAYPPPQPPGGYYQRYYMDPETQGLIPNRYDLMFYTGIGIFILLVMAFIFSGNHPIFFILMIVSLPIPMFPIYWDFKYSVKSTTGTLGNICATCWIIFQIIITVILGLIMI